MTKEIARKIWYCLYWVCLIYITVKFFLGKATTFDIAYMAIFYSLCTLLIALKIIQKVIVYKMYKTLVDGFEYLKAIHKMRYKLYFTGREEVEEYSAEIERFGNTILKFGEAIISSTLLSKKNTKRVEEILRQTQKLMTTN